MGMNRFQAGLALPRFVVHAALLTVLGIAPLMLSAQTAQPPAPAPKAETVTPAPQPPLPSARSIIDRHLKAVGGRDAVLAHSSTRAAGTFSVPSQGMTGAIEVFAAKPNKSMIKINIPGVGDILEGYDGKHGWTVNPMTGPMLLEGKQLEEKRFDADFHGELHDDSRYQSITTLERSEFDGRQCYKLRLVKKDGSEEFEFYDVATGLKAGRIATRETPMGSVTGTAVETDYKKFGKLLQPTTVKNTMMNMQQVITITSIEYDTVPASAFELPAEIRALIK